MKNQAQLFWGFWALLFVISLTSAAVDGFNHAEIAYIYHEFMVNPSVGLPAALTPPTMPYHMEYKLVYDGPELICDPQGQCAEISAAGVR